MVICRIISYTVLSELVVNYAHLYSYGTSKCQFLLDLLDLQIHNLKKLEFPQPHKFKYEYSCYQTCHKFPNIRCATRKAHALYGWIKHNLKTKTYVRCPKEMTHYTAALLQV